MLSNTCKYALRSIIYIGIKSTPERLVNVRTIATELQVPMQFLSKILQVFVRKGILTSVKGPAGGFRFSKDPFKVTLFEVVEIVDGTNLFESCIVGTRPCNSVDEAHKKCPVHDEYSSIRQEIVSFFKKETIGSIVNNFESKEKLFLEL